MEKIKRHFNQFILLYLTLLTLPAVVSLLVPGFFGASDDLHIAWLFEMHRALLVGQIPPRFVPDLSFGFGYPLFNFVFPLPFYIGEIFHLIGFNLVNSIKGVFFISFPMSAIFMYLFLRQFSSKEISFTGALLYVYTPYRFVDLYIRGAIGEVFAFSLLPLVGLSFLHLTNSSKISLKWIGLGGISLAFLILTHNITAYMFFPAILLLVIFRIIFFTKSVKKSAINVISAVFLGILISSYFWLPAIVESSLMKYDTVFNFSDHYPTIKQLITPFWGYGASVPGPYDLMPFYLGTVNWLAFLILLTCGFWVIKKIDLNQKIILLWAVLVFFSAFFMMNYRSTVVWSHLPLVPYFQFPWRFLILTTFVVPIFLVPLDYFKNKKWFCLFLVFLIFLTNLVSLRPNDFLGRKDDYYLNRYIPFPTASKEYKLTQEEYLRLPKATQIRPDRNFPRMTQNGESLNPILINSLDASLDFESTTPAIINYNKYNFPGWYVVVDDQPVEIISAVPYGQIEFKVPAGQHQIKVWFGETPFRLAWDIISLVSLIIAIVLIVIPQRYNRKDEV